MNHHDIIQKLCSAGYPTYLVGGAIRDMFAGFDPADFDITTLATPVQIKEVFSDARVNLDAGKFGVTLVEGVDVATFRTDQYPDSYGAKNCVVAYADSIHEDLSRRDLTINALALCPITGDVIDNHNGREDLRRRVLRLVGDPKLRILEDPNRIIRACRFVAKLFGTFDPVTLKALRESSELVRSRVDPERIGIEVRKAMELDQPSLFFSALHLVGVLDIVFPGMEASIDHQHGKWHKETIWEHLMLAGDKVSPKFPLVRLAAFLHDVGKPESFAHNNDGTFVGHEVRGADAVSDWLTDLKFSNSDRAQVVGLVLSHMWGGSTDATPRAIRKLLFKLSELGIDPRSWLRLRIADRHANLMKEDFTLSEIFERAAKVGIIGEEVNPLPFNVNSLLFKGGDIIKTFNLVPGPVVGQVQKHLLNFVIENGSEFNTREHLVVEAQVFLENNK